MNNEKFAGLVIVIIGMGLYVFGANGIVNAGLDTDEIKSMNLIHHLGTAIAVIGVVIALPISKGPSRSSSMRITKRKIAEGLSDDEMSDQDRKNLRLIEEELYEAEKAKS